MEEFVNVEKEENFFQKPNINQSERNNRARFIFEFLEQVELGQVEKPGSQ